MLYRNRNKPSKKTRIIKGVSWLVNKLARRSEKKQRRGLRR